MLTKLIFFKIGYVEFQLMHIKKIKKVIVTCTVVVVALMGCLIYGINVELTSIKISLFLFFIYTCFNKYCIDDSQILFF